jgi:hypothetical protein
MLAAKRRGFGAFDMFIFLGGVSPGVCVSASAHDLRFGTIRLSKRTILAIFCSINIFLVVLYYWFMGIL